MLKAFPIERRRNRDLNCGKGKIIKYYYIGNIGPTVVEAKWKLIGIILNVCIYNIMRVLVIVLFPIVYLFDIEQILLECYEPNTGCRFDNAHKFQIVNYCWGRGKTNS